MSESAESETEHVEIEIDLDHAREEIFRDLFQQVESPDREQNSENSGDPGGQDALGEKLEDDASAGRAERGADGDFFSPRGETGEQKIRDIRASDEQHAADGGEQREQHRPLRADQIFMERDHAHAGLCVHLVGIRGLVAPVDDVQLFVGLRAGHAGFHPAEDREVARAALDDIGRQSFLLEHARQPDVGLVKRKFDRRRRDADDRERCPVQRDRLAEDTLVAAETFLPEGMAQHRDVRTARAIVIGGEGAAEERLDAERAEEIFGDANALEIFRIAPAGEGESGERLRGELGETLLLIAPGGVARPGNIRAIEAAFGERTPGAHELLRLRIGERTQEERVDGGEENGVGANAEGQRDDGENGEAGLSQELSQSVAKVIHMLVSVDFSSGERRLPACTARQLAGRI